MAATIAPLKHLEQSLAHLRQVHRFRTLEPAAGVDFTSNDYLGLSRHPALRAAIIESLERDGTVGATGSRLLRGHQPAHAALEAFAARFFGAERALYFSTGYQANLALFTTLPDRHDAVVFDALLHASALDGIHAAACPHYKAAHNDVDAFADAIARARRRGAKRVWLAVESLYSMDGDCAPIDALLTLAAERDAVLIVDEAHATGIYGPTGRGLTESRYNDHLIVLHTCGKALGAAGGLVCAPSLVIDTLVNSARPFIYSTAPPPHLAAAVQRALTLIDEETWRRTRLLALTDLATRALRRVAGTRVAAAGTQIIPVILGEAETAVAGAAALQAAGYDVRAIRPPTVPPGTCRLRISLSCDRTEAEILGLADALAAMPTGEPR